jgi:hypothetical protein
MIRLNIILPSIHGSPQWFISLRFSHQNPVHAFPSPVRAKCPAYLNFRDFIIRTVVGEELTMLLLLRLLLLLLLSSFWY